MKEKDSVKMYTTETRSNSSKCSDNCGDSAKQHIARVVNVLVVLQRQDPAIHHTAENSSGATDPVH